MDLLDDSLSADGVDLAGLDNLETAVSVVVVVGQSRQRRADAGVDVGVIAHKTLLCGVVEVGTVVDGGDLGGGTTEDLGAPSVPFLGISGSLCRNVQREEERLTSESRSG